MRRPLKRRFGIILLLAPNRNSSVSPVSHVSGHNQSRHHVKPERGLTRSISINFPARSRFTHNRMRITNRLFLESSNVACNIGSKLVKFENMANNVASSQHVTFPLFTAPSMCTFGSYGLTTPEIASFMNSNNSKAFSSSPNAYLDRKA